jgi:hypothetical protein
VSLSREEQERASLVVARLLVFREKLEDKSEDYIAGGSDLALPLSQVGLVLTRRHPLEAHLPDPFG